MKFILPNRFFLIVILLIATPVVATARESEELFNIENVSSQYLKRDTDKITIIEYYDTNPPKISFSKNFEGYKCTINKIKCSPAMVYDLTLKGFKKPRKFNIEFTKGNHKKRTTIQLLPDDFSLFTVKGQSHLESNILFSRIFLDHTHKMKSVSELFSLKPSGEIYFYRRLPFSAVDFRPHELDGKKYYSYLHSEVSFSGISIIGKRELLDDKMQPVKVFPEFWDMHEFILLGLDWYIGTRYTSAKTPLGIDYINQELVEIKDGKEIYSWSIDELSRQSYMAGFSMKTVFFGKNSAHQHHLNGLQILPDNELLISLGHDGIIIIDKYTKKIKAAFGGANDQFGLTPEQDLGFIHTPRYDIKNQTLTVFHNNLHGKPFTVLEYVIDRNLKKINEFSIITSSKMISESMGSVEKNGNTYSIATGYITKLAPNFIEQDGKHINMQLIFKNPNAFIYRIYRASAL